MGGQDARQTAGETPALQILTTYLAHYSTARLNSRRLLAFAMSQTLLLLKYPASSF